MWGSRNVIWRKKTKMFGIPESVVLPVVGSVPVWALTGLAALLFFTGMLRKYGIKKKKDVATILAVATAILLLGAPATVAPGTPISPVDCLSTTVASVNLRAFDEYSPGTANTEGYLYRAVGSSGIWTAGTLGTAVTTLVPQTAYEYAVGLSLSDFTGNALGPRGTFTTKCSSAVDIMDIGVTADEDASGLTSTFYNGNHDASAQAITTSETKTVYLNYIAGNNEVFGNKFADTMFSNTLVLLLSTGNYSAPEAVWINTGIGAGQDLPKISCPSTVTGSATATNYCYAAPWIDEKGTEIAVKLVAKATNPTGDETAYLMGCGRYLDSKDNLIKNGCETDAGAAVGIAFASAESTTVDMS
jgi:hypothetical protein